MKLSIRNFLKSLGAAFMAACITPLVKASDKALYGVRAAWAGFGLPSDGEFMRRVYEFENKNRERIYTLRVNYIFLQDWIWARWKRTPGGGVPPIQFSDRQDFIHTMRQTYGFAHVLIDDNILPDRAISSCFMEFFTQSASEHYFHQRFVVDSTDQVMSWGEARRKMWMGEVRKSHPKLWNDIRTEMAMRKWAAKGVA